MKMNKLLMGTLFCALSTAANAAVFDVAGVTNLEWLDLTATAGMTRTQVEAQLGVNGTFDGWRYASRGEVETLYDGLWGGTTENFSADNLAGSQALFDAFGTSAYFDQFNNGGYRGDGITFWFNYYGSSAECGVTAYPDVVCVAAIMKRSAQYGAVADEGYFHDIWGLGTGLDNENLTQVVVKDAFYWSSADFSGANGELAQASYLVRELAPVPVPAAVWLFGSGLLGLLGFARRKQV